jgi:hypothetical protein
MKCPFCTYSDLLTLEFSAENPTPYGREPYLYNVYVCGCGAICKENIWQDKSKIWISTSNNVVIEV